MAGTDYVQVVVLAGVLIVFLLILQIILRVAKKKKKNPLIPKPDPFFKDNNYSWDYVFVFKVWDENDRVNKNDDLKTKSKHSMKHIIDKLNYGGLETSCFFSAQKDEIYVKIRAEPSRLKDEASRIKYNLQLDEERLRIKLQSGKKEDGKKVWDPIIISDDHGVSEYQFNKFIFGPYDKNPDVQPLYKIHPNTTMFRGVDRVKLIISIIEAKESDGSDASRGCDLPLNEMIVDETVLAAFAIHDYDELEELEKDLLQFFRLNTPIDKIKDYFGEKVGMYFLFLDFYTRWIFPPAVFGLVTYLDKALGEGAQAYLILFYAAFMVVWSFMFTEYWKREQVEHAMMWGVKGFEEEQQDRPQFKGIQISSPIDGKEMTYFPESKRRRLLLVSFIVTMVSIIVVLVVVAGVVYFSSWLREPPQLAAFNKMPFLSYIGTGDGPATSVASIISSCVNAFVINLLDLIYGRVASYLTNYENHRTDTEYEDHFIFKIFFFQLINSYASLVYTAFIKKTVEGCSGDDCLTEVSTALGTIFVVRLLLVLCTEIFLPIWLSYIRRREESRGLDPGVTVSPIESQYTLAQFDNLRTTLEDYAELIIQFGYIYLFAAAFPFVPVVGFCAGYLLMKIQGWKYLQVYRRPDPKAAEDIGTWQVFLELVSTLSIMTNLGLVIFTDKYPWLNDQTASIKWLFFIGIEHILLLIKYIVSVGIDDTPASVEMQIERNKFYVQKVLKNERDEYEGKSDLTSHSTDLNINLTDVDWIRDPDAEDMKADENNEDTIDAAEEIRTPATEKLQELRSRSKGVDVKDVKQAKV